MTNFYICRHGETENNKAGRLSGWIDTPLTVDGITNAHNAAQKLVGKQFDGIISSDLGRAFITAYIIAHELGFKNQIVRNAGLREINYGFKANMLISEVMANFPDLDFMNQGGETMIEMQQRVLSTLAEIAADNRAKTILLVAHDGTINAINASFLAQEVSVVGAASHNGHDFVASFSYDDGLVSNFKPLEARVSLDQ